MSDMKLCLEDRECYWRRRYLEERQKVLDFSSTMNDINRCVEERDKAIAEIKRLQACVRDLASQLHLYVNTEEGFGCKTYTQIKHADTIKAAQEAGE